MDYVVDDFGNTVAVTFPWTSHSGARQTTEYEYDARGNVTKYRTPSMAAAGNTIENNYDQLGRLTERKRLGSPTYTLFKLKYDNSAPVDTGCPNLTNGNGRLTYKEDSFGKTWYLYDARGQVVREARWRAGTTAGCGTDSPIWDQDPDTIYSYTNNGELASITYPHGRQVIYVYPSTGAMDRPQSIQLRTWSGTAWSGLTTVIDNITWEPYGGLRAYRLVNSSKRVEYLLAGQLETTPSGSTCATLSSGGVATDGSGRLRAVMVSDDTSSLGNPDGNIFKQVYTWNSDQLVDQRTCHRNKGNPVVVTYGYDKLPRLKSETDVLSGTSSTTNSLTWSLRDNPGNPTFTAMTGAQSCTQGTDYFTAAWQKDLLFSVKWGTAYGAGPCNGSSGKYNYLYDLDGRRTATWDESAKWKYTAGWGQDFDGAAGIDSVFKSATFEVAGSPISTYSYYYDGFGRRRAKMFPDSTTDEYFYDMGHQMLSDRGNNSAGGELPEDDYVWLGGRPVLMVRGKFSVASMTRYADGSGNCNRDGEVALCGTYALVTDYIGKPVLMLDSEGRTAGTGTYEAFGYNNRREYRWGAHNGAGSTTITPPGMPSEFDGPLRVLTSRTNYSASTVTLAGYNEDGALKGNRAHTWSNWRYASGNSWTLSWSGNASEYGIDVEAYEVQAKQTWVWWAWTPLRFPGHYYDKETELNENWNRYFDPRTSRYLSPEPKHQDPGFVLKTGANGFAVPTYAYAYNNPLKYTDPDGLDGLCLNSHQCECQRDPHSAGCTGVSPETPSTKPPEISPLIPVVAVAKAISDAESRRLDCNKGYEDALSVCMDLVNEKRGSLREYWKDPLYKACECWADLELQKCRGKVPWSGKMERCERLSQQAGWRP